MEVQEGLAKIFEMGNSGRMRNPKAISSKPSRVIPAKNWFSFSVFLYLRYNAVHRVPAITRA